MNGNTDEEQGSFMQRLQESPRTVSALIIILIVAAAIYAFSGDDNQPAAATITPTTEESIAGEMESTGVAAEEEQQDTAMREEDTAIDAAAPELPHAERTEEGFVEVAQAGDGYTHLARRAATKWLSENQVNFAVTDEHRIYVEDYIQNQLGSDGMALGQSQLITFDLIKEAVAAAGELDENELTNLRQYTSALK